MVGDLPAFAILRLGDRLYSPAVSGRLLVSCTSELPGMFGPRQVNISPPALWSCS